MVSQDSYHGWVIQIAQEQEGYTFQCQRAEQQIGVTDAQKYLTMEQAICAGRIRADLESVRLSLTNFLHGKLQLLRLHTDERIALENSIAQYIDTANRQFS